MLKKVGIVIGVILLVIIIGIMMLPKNVVVERSTVINAPVSLVYDQVNELENWANWSVWAQRDPDMKTEYSGEDKGAGSTYCWEGDPDKTGKGCLTITENVENASINTLLEFEGMGPGHGSWSFEEGDEGVKVTWAMNSDLSNSFIAPIFGLFMDGLVGPDFETGLANLKEYSENLPTSSIEVEEVDIPAMTIVSMRRQASMEEIGPAMEEIWETVGAYMAENNLEMGGAPFAIYYEWEESFDFEFAFPISSEFEGGTDDIMVKQMDGFRGLKAIHMGDYANTGETHGQLMEYVQMNGIELAGDPMEFYPTSPEETDTSQWVTEIVYPI